MNLSRSVRVLIALAIVVLSLAALLLLLTISEATLNVQARLAEAPAWLGFIFWGLIGSGGLLSGWLLWRVLRPTAKARKPAAQQGIEAPTEGDIDAAMQRADALGADTAQIRRELDELRRRREAGEIHVALFGEISTGKSALIQALVPDAEARSDVRGGTTRTLDRYTWHSSSGDALQLIDMPGTAEADGDLDRMVADEAKRAHIVVYVTDSDINRAQHAVLQELIALKKPLVLALNKSDLYSADEAAALSERLTGLIREHPYAEFVSVSAATSRQVVRQLPDGSEHIEMRDIPPKVEPLRRALQRMIDDNQQILDQLRDSATFVLAAQQLDEAIAISRKAKADKLVDTYSVKAMVGAMAAVAPGSDLLIQGWLGTQMVKELAALYDTKVGKVDTELLLKLVQKHVAKAHTLLLAVAGNALKAFPGIGTLAGGGLHAIAYGIIFRTLGRALTTTLATRGELHPRQTAKAFEEKLGEDMETSARSLAKMVIEQARRDERQGD